MFLFFFILWFSSASKNNFFFALHRPQSTDSICACKCMFVHVYMHFFFHQEWASLYYSTKTRGNLERDNQIDNNFSTILYAIDLSENAIGSQFNLTSATSPWIKISFWGIAIRNRHFVNRIRLLMNVSKAIYFLLGSSDKKLQKQK